MSYTLIVINYKHRQPQGWPIFSKTGFYLMFEKKKRLIYHSDISDVSVFD